MKAIFSLIFAVLFVAAPSQAAISLVFSNLNFAGVTSNLGSASFTGLGNNNQTVRDLTVEVSGLDLTGDNSANDLFTFVLRASGSSDVIRNNTTDNFGIRGGNQNGRINAGESVTFSIFSTAVTLRNPAPSGPPTVLFDGFSAVESSGFSTNGTPGTTPEFALSGGTGVENPGITVAGDIAFTNQVSSFTITGVGGGIRVGSIDGSFIIVLAPEPSSAAFLGLGGFLLLLRRRR